jgi:hypothetical protein
MNNLSLTATAHEFLRWMGALSIDPAGDEIRVGLDRCESERLCSMEHTWFSERPNASRIAFEHREDFLRLHDRHEIARLIASGYTVFKADA